MIWRIRLLLYWSGLISFHPLVQTLRSNWVSSLIASTLLLTPHPQTNSVFIFDYAVSLPCYTHPNVSMCLAIYTGPTHTPRPCSSSTFSKTPFRMFFSPNILMHRMQGRDHVCLYLNIFYFEPYLGYLLGVNTVNRKCIKINF